MGTRAGQERARQETGAKGGQLGHRREARQPAPAKQLQQNGFQLVVFVVRSEQDLTSFEVLFQQRVACLARSSLQRFSPDAFDLRRKNLQRNVESARQIAAMRTPSGRVGMKPVIDVHSAQSRVSASRCRESCQKR